MWNWIVVAVVILQEDPAIEGTLTFECQAEDFDKALEKARELAEDYTVVELKQGDEVENASKT